MDGPYQTRLPPEEADMVDSLTDKGMSQSEAVRRLVIDGVQYRDADTSTSTSPSTTGQFVGCALLSFSVALSVFSVTIASGVVASAAAIVFLATAVDQYRGGDDGD